MKEVRIPGGPKIPASRTKMKHGCFNQTLVETFMTIGLFRAYRICDIGFGFQMSHVVQTLPINSSLTVLGFQRWLSRSLSLRRCPAQASDFLFSPRSPAFFIPALGFVSFTVFVLRAVTVLTVRRQRYKGWVMRVLVTLGMSFPGGQPHNTIAWSC